VAAARSVGILYGMKPAVTLAPAAPAEFLRISRAIEYLADHVQQQPSLAEIAAAAHWSEYHFAR
jgi:AraC family transcriptional regulator of adaptative response/methylated-DNA-[protein]-cysteine methyltransferase